MFSYISPEIYWKIVFENTVRMSILFPKSLKLDSHKTLHKKMKFSIKGFFSKRDQIRSFLRIWSHLLKKPLMENFIFLRSEV